MDQLSEDIKYILTQQQFFRLSECIFEILATLLMEEKTAIVQRLL